MRGSIKRVTSVGISTIVLAASLGMVGAAPASAEDGYAPQLDAAPAAEQKFAEFTETPATLVAPAAKRAARIPSARRATTVRSVSSVSRSGGSQTARARQLLQSYIQKYPILAGTTVSYGDARGHQAIAYYQSGRIVISPNHSASLERIIGHEIWHIIDWRDNGRIDWGENVPPKR